MPDTKMQSGWKHMKPCSNDPQCNIFFGVVVEGKLMLRREQKRQTDGLRAGKYE